MDSDAPAGERTGQAGLTQGGSSLEQHLGRMEAFLHTFTERGPFKFTFSVEKATAQRHDPDAPQYMVSFSGEDADLLLERNATLLEALEWVALKASRLDDDQARKIAFDCDEWRQLRAEELRMMAQIAAERVIDRGDPFVLNPMNARERRIVHLALRDNPQVRTQSEGMGPERKVIIFPASPAPRGARP